MSNDLFQLLTPVSQASLSTQEVLTRLKFIGTIQPGEKLNVSNLKIEPNSYVAPLKRYWYNESRKETYQFVYSIIEQAFIILFTLAPSRKISDVMVCQNILIDLNQALQGVHSLQETYKDDNLFVCDLKTLIQAVESKIKEAKQKHPELSSEELPVLAVQTVVAPQQAASTPPLEENKATEKKKK